MVNLILLSKVLGWIYTTAWSTSFYPQLVLNYRRKSVSGLSLDFLFLNVLGFACYATFNVVLYSSDSVREEYRGRNDGSNPSVQLNDVAFASHALLISSLTLLQSFLYKRDANQHLSSFNRTFILAAMASIGLATIGVELIDRIGWLDFMYLLSYIKIYISFAKYVPQALLNIQRKSTIGWSIINILLDFTGGTLSLVQLVLDSYIAQDHWSSITGNPGKLGLSLLSISFDIVFMLQHYVIYRASNRLIASRQTIEDEEGRDGVADDERSRLLNS